MEKLNKDKLILPVVILLASLVFGGFYYASQVSKQKSIERQQQVKIEEERHKEDEQGEKEKAEKKAEELKNAEMRVSLSQCLFQAEEEYLGYAKLNGTEKADGTIWANNAVWDRAEKTKKEAEEMCLKKYPISE